MEALHSTRIEPKSTYQPPTQTQLKIAVLFFQNNRMINRL